MIAFWKNTLKSFLSGLDFSLSLLRTPCLVNYGIVLLVNLFLFKNLRFNYLFKIKIYYNKNYEKKKAGGHLFASGGDG